MEAARTGPGHPGGEQSDQHGGRHVRQVCAPVAVARRTGLAAPRVAAARPECGGDGRDGDPRPGAGDRHLSGTRAAGAVGLVAGAAADLAGRPGLHPGDRGACRAARGADGGGAAGPVGGIAAASAADGDIRAGGALADDPDRRLRLPDRVHGPRGLVLGPGQPGAGQFRRRRRGLPAGASRRPDRGRARVGGVPRPHPRAGAALARR